MKHYYPNFDEFLKIAEQGNTVPVYRQLLADALTPVTAYQRLAEPAEGPVPEHSFLLESVVGGEQIARYSFVAADPEATFTARGDRIVIRRGADEQVIESHDPLAELGKLLADFRPVAALPGLPRFTGGIVGYAAYDMVRYYEDLGDGPPDDRGLSDLSFGLYRTMVIFDHVSKTIKIVSNAHITDDPGAAYNEACAAIERTIQRLRHGGELSVAEINRVGLPQKPYESNFTRKRYMETVEACKEYIRAGDIFQVVPSQRLTVETTARPFQIYRSLRVVNPSPFMFLLRSSECTLVGSSPEILCRVENGIVTNRPLAGTRPRGASDEQDRALEEELRNDPKERAEHIMLVDLARNDVGRVAEPRSVVLSDVMSIERYSHVMHIVSDVKGRLAEGMTAFDALRAALPVGTVSGAPKIRAMQIIDEFEPTRRGPYAGAVGYVDFSGNMDTCIALRTMVIAGGKVYVQAGGGVVADSDAATEYQETINKARALLHAIEVAESGVSE
ncbi:MAG: Anthranilate synthase component 1 [Planctomycetes bacterium ADurb.Bin126]|nr:MAG: Anthranilate synthase component 1 [Planctomycetes bacterium ADurb.Bin126]HOD84668.1 anthranilate synthase component I [Phycisphaerae bacterium]HQL73577.1 anthranilate synthase component I [Phycisphaerae bacterium]